MKVYITYPKKYEKFDYEIQNKVIIHYNSNYFEMYDSIEIINAKDVYEKIPEKYKIDDQYGRNFFDRINLFSKKEISKCSVLYAFSSEQEKYTSGCLFEVTYAKEIGINVINMNFDGINIPESFYFPNSVITPIFNYIYEQDKIYNDNLNIKLTIDDVIKICKFKNNDKEYYYSLSRFSQWSRKLAKDNKYLKIFNIYLDGKTQILYINKGQKIENKTSELIKIVESNNKILKYSSFSYIDSFKIDNEYESDIYFNIYHKDTLTNLIDKCNYDNILKKVKVSINNIVRYFYKNVFKYKNNFKVIPSYDYIGYDVVKCPDYRTYEFIVIDCKHNKVIFKFEYKNGNVISYLPLIEPIIKDIIKVLKDEGVWE